MCLLHNREWQDSVLQEVICTLPVSWVLRGVCKRLISPVGIPLTQGCRKAESCKGEVCISPRTKPPGALIGDLVRHTASSTKSFRCSFFSEHYIPNSDQMRTVVSLERKNRELIPTQRFGLREGAAQWITGSTSTPPFVLPSSHQHEMENALLFLISATRVAGKDRCFGQVLLPRPPDERQVGTAILFLSCQHWSTGKRSCHAVGEELSA